MESSWATGGRARTQQGHNQHLRHGGHARRWSIGLNRARAHYPSGITAVALAVAGNQGTTHIVAASSAGHVTGSSVLQPLMIARVPIVAFFTIE